MAMSLTYSEAFKEVYNPRTGRYEVRINPDLVAGYDYANSSTCSTTAIDYAREAEERNRQRMDYYKAQLGGYSDNWVTTVTSAQGTQRMVQAPNHQVYTAPEKPAKKDIQSLIAYYYRKR